MLKKLLALSFSMLLACGLYAQELNNNALHASKSAGAKSISFPASNIQFWTGTGSNSAVVVIAWDDYATPTAYAWGVRWNGNVSALDLVDTIQAYDSRFHNGSTATVASATYTGNGVTLTSENDYWCYTVNGDWATVGYTGYTMSNGDIMEISGSCAFSMTTAVAATNPNPVVPEDATFNASDILYWVGTGSNEAVFAVNWADTALAWGYRFNGESASVSTVMADIAAADPRFSYVIGSYGVDDITFTTNNHTYAITPNNYWWSLLNHVGGMGLSDVLHDGDFYKWGDLSVAVITDSTYVDYGEYSYWDYTYVWPYTIYPVNTPIPEDATISSEDILFWVGTGSNEAILAVNWADTALAWGYRFDSESANVSTMMADIAAADPRFNYVIGSYGIDDITFTTDNNTYAITPGNYWWSLLNHVGGMGLSDVLHDGDFYKWGDLSVAVITDSTYVDYGEYSYWDYTYVWPYAIYPVDNPIPEDASISANQIEYWVGHGNNKVVLAVNWADTALAWGYRFNDESVSVRTMMDSIAANDPRFNYVIGSYGVDDITFTTDNHTYAITPGNYWWSLLNHVGGMGLNDMLHDGDFYKWGDLSVAVITDSTWMDYGEYSYWDYTYVWPYAIYPVSNISEVGPFCGAAGTEGSTAVAYNDSRIKGWATGCTIERGPQNLSNNDSPLVTFGTEEDAIGAASTSTMDVVSLGDGGSATLTFAHPIRNGEGYDFAVFENSFDDYFLELAFVEVSSDGERFVRFPATSFTQTDSQVVSHVDPTFINNLAGKYRVGYGTPFDLEELSDSTGIDINNITHVRVIDVVGSIDPQYGSYDAYGHIVNDPFPTITHSAGFDLDGVCVLNSTVSIDDVEQPSMVVYPNPASSVINVRLSTQSKGTDMVLYDMTGRIAYRGTLAEGSTQAQIITTSLPNGIYMLRIGEEVVKIAVKR